MMFSEPYEGEAYKSDVKSMYASIMHSGTNFPYKRGEFMTIDNNDFDISRKTAY